MSEGIEVVHYARARRERYLQEIGVPSQVGSIVDELRALRATLGHEGAASFTSLCERIDAIKADIPKE